MKSLLLSCALALLVAALFVPQCAADDPAETMLRADGYTVSLNLKFNKHKQNPLERVVTFLDWDATGYATGFVVDDGLVLTAYHAVSGDISSTKKVMLGFGAKDQLDVRVYVNGCQATVLRTDPAADLALLKVCRAQRDTTAPAFQPSLNKDEQLLVVARPHGEKMVRRGVFSGPVMFRGQQYWSAKIEGRDGYSGSPVYNGRAELVGVFSGYDWAKNVAVISPSDRAQKLLQDYLASAKQ